MVTLNDAALTLEEVARVARGLENVEIDQGAVKRTRASRDVVEPLAEGEAPAYAINTGVGPLADTRLPAGDLEQLQRNVVRSHACGVGEPLPREAVRAVMLIRANGL